MDAGIALSLYAMPGLGGLDRSFAHATHTADVLNEIDPDYIRLRPFAPRPGTPLFDAYQRGDLGLLSPHGMIREIGMLVERLATTGKLCFDHMRNPSYRTRRAGQRVVPLFDQGYEGYQFPGAKQAVLEIVRRGLEIPESDYVRVEELMGATL